MIRSRLRTYAPMKRRSLKVRKAEPDFRKVYAQVDRRSDGRCEVVVGGSRCTRRATEHHHLVRPRRQHHQPDLILHVCRAMHERMSYPYKRGRLVWMFPEGGGRHEFLLCYAANKWAARQPQAG